LQKYIHTAVKARLVYCEIQKHGRRKGGLIFRICQGLDANDTIEKLETPPRMIVLCLTILLPERLTTKGLSETNSKTASHSAVSNSWKFQGGQIGTTASFRSLANNEFGFLT
jgi:hypothetical protein